MKFQGQEGCYLKKCCRASLNNLYVQAKLIISEKIVLLCTSFVPKKTSNTLIFHYHAANLGNYATSHTSQTRPRKVSRMRHGLQVVRFQNHSLCQFHFHISVICQNTLATDLKYVTVKLYLQ